MRSEKLETKREIDESKREFEFRVIPAIHSLISTFHFRHCVGFM